MKRTTLRIDELLRHGCENAITGEVLADIAGVKYRTLKREIQRLRRQGVPIMSARERGTAGYYLPSSKEEIKHCRNTIMKQGTECIKTARAFDAYLNADPNQLPIPVPNTGLEKLDEVVAKLDEALAVFDEQEETISTRNV